MNAEGGFLTSPTDEEVPVPCAVAGPRREPMRSSSSRAAVAALRRSDFLCLAGRPDDALAAVMRPLGRPPRDPDLLARLRIARGTASWLAGPPGPARVHIDKALRRAAVGLTRARALAARAQILSAEQSWDEARVLLAEAIPLYRAAGHPALCDALQLLAKTARDAGDLESAIATQGASVACAREAGAGDRLSDALTYRATLLTLAGRLADARSDLAAARPSDDAPAPLRTRWCEARAMLELTEGDLPAAREALVDAEAGIAEGVDPRTRGEVLLLLSDLCLADGEHAAAGVEAARAFAEFHAVGDTAGECRSRVRRAHALLGTGRPDEALREARRALKATGARADLRTLALVTQGRIQLRSNADDARCSFAAAAEHEPEGSSLGAAARIGHAVALGGGATSPDVQRALRMLEDRGDRRILSYCLGDLQVLCGSEPAAAPIPARQVDADPVASCLVTAAAALSSEADLGERVVAALAAVRPVLAWWRAAVVGEGGFGLRADRAQPAPLRPDELAVRLAARGGGPAIVDLRASEVWRRDPECALHGLACAWLVPAGPSRVLYVDTRDPSPAAGERALDLLVQLARLLAPHLGAPPAGPGPEDPPALPGIVGRSAPMEAMVREVMRAAAGTGVVHIFGETGTGKERVAHAIHLRSARTDGPWVPVNASSVSDDLFESEMFGHVRGAFSGAVADRRGYVSEAEGGTLFLDEVTDLSPKAQAKLLRFVQDREYRRVGDPRLHRANVRLVTAANVPLDECVRRGTFRQDLMYRLCQETIMLPALRERGDDVARLARHFLRAGHGPAPAVAPAVWGLLARHHWPGNVRELESEMARALARAAGGTVRPEHLSVGLQRAPRGPLRPLRQAIAEFEREHVARALERNGGNRALTAAHLGVSRQALLAKINRLGIGPGLR